MLPGVLAMTFRLVYGGTVSGFAAMAMYNKCFVVIFENLKIVDTLTGYLK